MFIDRLFLCIACLNIYIQARILTELVDTKLMLCIIAAVAICDMQSHMSVCHQCCKLAGHYGPVHCLYSTA